MWRLAISLLAVIVTAVLFSKPKKSKPCPPRQRPNVPPRRSEEDDQMAEEERQMENPSAEPESRPDAEDQRDTDDQRGTAESDEIVDGQETKDDDSTLSDEDVVEQDTDEPDDDDYVHVDANLAWQRSPNPLARFLPEGTSFDNHYNIAIVGSQGVGKTTLVTDLRAMAGLSKLDAAQTIVKAQGKGFQLSPDDLAALEQSMQELTIDDEIMAARQKLIEDGAEVDKPGIGNDDRDPTPWIISDTTTIWDLPGAGTEKCPTATAVDDLGLRHMSAVVVVVGLHEHETINEMVDALHQADIPLIMVQTHFDQYVENNLRSDYYAWIRAGKNGTDFLTPANTKPLIKRRRQELRDIYKLQAKDYVHCVNLTPCPPDIGYPFPASSYELSIMQAHIFDVARAAHEY
eukprot:TRINITY_DN5565_c0_g1_i1.p1 TRINITY_DN5565_c0_g1~~TRINITY_DN5565_c0_g1_i1.p1  ORF type:complete len:403 (+),score=97.85 TRINITY_DN5565_c0_g1_i1:34-1242(+)